jgi:hypothetical protein
MKKLELPSHPSLRFQAHWQNTQSQRYNQILPKSLPALPTPTHGQKDNAAKIKDGISEDKNGQLVTGGIFYCRDSRYFSVSASNKLSCSLTGQCFEIGNKNIPPKR